MAIQEEMPSEGAVEAEDEIWTSSSCYAASIVLVGSTLFIDLLFEVTESVHFLPQPYGLTISIF